MLGVVPSSINLVPHRTVLGNLVEGPMQVRGLSRRDAETRAKELLARVREGMTMIVVTHEIAFASEVADHVVFMDGGVVVEEGRPEAVIGAPQHERTRSFLARVTS